jgi:hypothetical protein
MGNIKSSYMNNSTHCFLTSEKSFTPRLSTIRAILEYSRALRVVGTEIMGSVKVILN